MRPFVLGAKVSPLGCSRPLQRAIVDFAADQPFAQARAKLQEHYGFAIGESTIQRITFAHAQAMHESSRRDLEFPEAPGLRKPIVVETDGGMVPIVEPSSEEKDKRKGKTLSWREAKLSLAHAQGNCTPVYAGSIEGGVEEAGRNVAYVYPSKPGIEWLQVGPEMAPQTFQIPVRDIYRISFSAKLRDPVAEFNGSKQC